jgi:hypothetical protein
VFEAAGYQLPLKVYRQKPRAGVDVLVARHRSSSISIMMGEC